MKKKLIFWVVFVGVAVILGLGVYLLERSGILADALLPVSDNNKVNVYRYSELTGQEDAHIINKD
ncbi:MAG: hypothetical protein WCP91_01275 [Candidatus Berkelbacteria bacterium]